MKQLADSLSQTFGIEFRTQPARLTRAQLAALPLPAGAMEALQAFAARNGRCWKQKLRDCWYRASYPGVSSNHSAALQGLRNHPSYGPGSGWLEAFKLPPAHKEARA